MLLVKKIFFLRSYVISLYDTKSTHSVQENFKGVKGEQTVLHWWRVNGSTARGALPCTNP